MNMSSDIQSFLRKLLSDKQDLYRVTFFNLMFPDHISQGYRNCLCFEDAAKVSSLQEDLCMNFVVSNIDEARIRAIS